MKPINKEILKIAIPNIIGNITVPLIGIVDTMLMGYEKTNSKLLIGAIALGGVIFNAIYWNFGFIRIATTGITAQAFGQKDKQLQALTFFRAIIVGILLTILIFLLKDKIADKGFALLMNEKNKEAISIAKDYFNIRILAAPAVLILYSFRGWFYGMQNAKHPLILTFVVNITNVIASIYFVKAKQMGAEGVALGTVVAQYVCLLTAFILLFSNYSWIFKWLKLKAIFVWKQLRRFFIVSSFVFFRTVMLFLVFASFTKFSSAINEDYFAVNQMLLELFYLMSFAVDGFAYASEALVGKYIGAKNNEKLHESIRWTLIWGLGFGLVYALSYIIAGKYFLRIFTPDWELIQQGTPYLFWLSIISIVGAIAFIWDGIYIGATLAWQLFASMLAAFVSYFLVYYLLKESYPKHAIWAAMTSFMLVRGLLQWILFRMNNKQLT